MSLPKRITDMHTLYGRQDSQTCGACAMCLRRSYHRKTYFKCVLNRQSRGAATDWRASWPACGKFLERKESS